MHTLSPQALALRKRVSAPAGSMAVDHCLGHEYAVVGRRAIEFMGIQVIPLPNSPFGPSFRLEVEGRIDHILTIGEEKFHLTLRRPTEIGRFES